MRQGAVGFSTGLIYIPGTYASSDEVVALGQAAAKHGGVYASHMRDEGAHVTEAIEEALRVGREARMPVELSHFKIDNRRLWGSSEKSLALVEKARREGVDVVVDQYPYDHSSTNLGITHSQLGAGRRPGEATERFTDKATRARLVKEMVENVKKLGHKDYSYATVASCRSDHSYEGRTSARSISPNAGRRGSRTRRRPSSTCRLPEARRWCTTRWGIRTSSASCATRIRRWGATAACANSDRACPIPAPTAPMPACSPSTCGRSTC